MVRACRGVKRINVMVVTLVRQLVRRKLRLIDLKLSNYRMDARELVKTVQASR